ncbi:hypothetical protein GS483_00290 [Rhodococcus hoagii]|nr:hypothetical protein [Prescottella equi]
MSEHIQLETIRHPRINQEVMTSAVAGFANMSTKMAESVARASAEAARAITQLDAARKAGRRR